MAYKGDWKKVKSLLASYKYSGDRFVTPVFAHWNSNPVKANPKSAHFFQTVDHEYSYLVTLIKSGEKYQAGLYIYIIDFDKETPLIYEIKHFTPFNYKDLIAFLTTPSKLFSIRKKHKEVRVYENTQMTEEEFEREIELCRKKQT